MGTRGCNNSKDPLMAQVNQHQSSKRSTIFHLIAGMRWLCIQIRRTVNWCQRSMTLPTTTYWTHTTSFDYRQRIRGPSTILFDNLSTWWRRRGIRTITSRSILCQSTAWLDSLSFVSPTPFFPKSSIGPVSPVHVCPDADQFMDTRSKSFHVVQDGELELLSQYGRWSWV
jgi:hypothetical protein